MTRELKKQLRAIAEDVSVKARPEWLKTAREQLLTQISNTVPDRSEVSPRAAVFELSNLFLPRNFITVMRPVMAVVLAIGVTASGWIASVSATENCLPGEMCYGVKMATEKTREFVVAVTSDKSGEAHMHLEFAAKRAVEAGKVLDKKAPDAAVQAAVAIDHLNKSLKSAGDSLKQAMDSNPQDAVNITKDVNIKSKEIVDTLKEVNEKTVADTDLKKEVLESSKLAKATSINTLAMVVQKQADGEVKVDAEDVKTLVQDKIKEMISDAEAVKTQASMAVGTLPESASTTVTLTPIMAELANSMATNSPIVIVTSTSGAPAITADKTVIVVTSTQTVVLPPTVVKTFVDQAMVKVDESAAVAKTGAEKAVDFANNNQLVEAVAAIREVTNVTTNAETVMSNVNQVVKEVIPAQVVVPVVASTSSITVATSTNSTTAKIAPKTSQ
ncbi:MAG TPA: DUF5667 domain-containing protein [Candidatus Magasanikbacteria bacterium]|nr:DUF5667 domain-containing protein [Candidatus Magasanikbacteria bacterium]